MADMSREEAARVLTDMVKYYSEALASMESSIHPTIINYVAEEATALRMGAAALRGWVRTADRLPAEADEGGYGVVVAYNKAMESDDEMGLAACVRAWVVREGPQWWTYWLPLPPLPETGGAEGTKING